MVTLQGAADQAAHAAAQAKNAAVQAACAADQAHGIPAR